MNVGSTTFERSMPGRTCFTRYQMRDLCSSASSSTCSPACTEHQYSLYRNRTCHSLHNKWCPVNLSSPYVPTVARLIYWHIWRQSQITSLGRLLSKVCIRSWQIFCRPGSHLSILGARRNSMKTDQYYYDVQEIRSTAPHIVNLSTTSRWMVSFTLQLLYS
jgi:hypothetical protein